MIQTSKIEIRELIKAWLAISIAFTILLHNTPIGILNTFIISLLTVGLGFLLHELAHKITAQRYGCEAEFRAHNTMLLIAIASAFLGFIFAAPGAVQIKGFITYRENGIISVAGPLTNLALALLFLPLSLAPGILGTAGSIGFLVNAILGLFNMLPIKPLDGYKVITWNKKIYALVTITLLITTLYALL